MSLVLFIAVVALLWAITTKKPKSQLPLPPGPKRRPIIGNLLDLPVTRPWETYLQWCDKYSEYAPFHMPLI